MGVDSRTGEHRDLGPFNPSSPPVTVPRDSPPPAPSTSPEPTICILPVKSVKRRIGVLQVLRLDDAELPPPHIEHVQLPAPPGAQPVVRETKFVPIRYEDAFFPWLPPGPDWVQPPSRRSGSDDGTEETFLEQVAAWRLEFEGVEFSAPVLAGETMVPAEWIEAPQSLSLDPSDVAGG
ncbi:MAG: hypothetical protein L3K13_06275 [Thermoplasmata archaeon]|nr:hypothetical protein [Thermoplasmata archaeon]